MGRFGSLDVQCPSCDAAVGVMCVAYTAHRNKGGAVPSHVTRVNRSLREAEARMSLAASVFESGVFESGYLLPVIGTPRPSRLRVWWAAFCAWCAEWGEAIAANDLGER